MTIFYDEKIHLTINIKSLYFSWATILLDSVETRNTFCVNTFLMQVPMFLKSFLLISMCGTLN